MCCARGNLWGMWLTVPGSWSTFNKLPAARTALHFTCSKDSDTLEYSGDVLHAHTTTCESLQYVSTELLIVNYCNVGCSAYS